MKILAAIFVALLFAFLWLGLNTPHDPYQPNNPECKYIITVHGIRYCASSYEFTGGFVRYQWDGKTWPIREKYVQQIREN